MNNTRKDQIFIVDDSQIQLILLEKILTKEGFTVRAFINGYKLLEALKDQRPNLIISDIDMPVLDAFDLIERVKRKTEKPDIPFFLISSNSDSSIRKKAREAGAEVFIQKPYKSQALIDVVREVVGPVKV